MTDKTTPIQQIREALETGIIPDGDVLSLSTMVWLEELLKSLQGKTIVDEKRLLEVLDSHYALSQSYGRGDDRCTLELLDYIKENSDER